MNKRDTLIKILSIPIYPKEGANPTEVVADYLLDNEVEPIRHGYWIYNLEERKYIKDFTCSLCGNHEFLKTRYCGYCGARMVDNE